MESVFQINQRNVGLGQPCFITAEIGINHDGEPETAERMVQVASECGVDAVKFQVFQADSFVSADIQKAAHQKATLGPDRTVADMWRRVQLSPETLARLSDLAGKCGIALYASAFDPRSVELLGSLGVPMFKVASGELTNLPLIRQVAEMGSPILISVGMATLGEIEAALNSIAKTGNNMVGLLHCVSDYPCDPQKVNLKRMVTLRKAFGVPVGYSDHTDSVWACVAAVTMGASFIEKHFTLNKNRPGTDHALSADPPEIARLVEGIRTVEAALGKESFDLSVLEHEGRVLFRRGLVANQTILQGTTITATMISSKRPARGISPADSDLIVGREARRDIPEGAPITWEDV